MKNILNYVFVLTTCMFLTACSNEQIPQAHKGRMFDKTGVLALYTGGEGFTGPILEPGTFYTGFYDEIKMVECAESTDVEKLSSLTKDGVQFNIEVFVRNQPNCDANSVKWILNNIIIPDKQHKISADYLYKTYVTPSLHSAMREAVSMQNASDMNDKRLEVTKVFLDKFKKLVSENQTHPMPITVSEVSISNFDFPESMKKANSELALQTTLTKLAVAQREKNAEDIKTEQAKIIADTETQKLKAEQEKEWGKAQVASMRIIGDFVERNPAWLKYDMQQKLPTIAESLGKNGNVIMMDSRSGNFILQMPKENK